MKLILKEHRERMLANFENEGPDHAPVVKWFCPWGAATWLLTEMKTGDEDILFGLCDLGQGFPETGYVSRSEIETLRGPGGLTIERDIHFKPKATLSVYAHAARTAESIATRETDLVAAYRSLKQECELEGKDYIGSLLSPDTGERVSLGVFQALRAVY